jgi:putative tricarboxylic transport membrane protein
VIVQSRLLNIRVIFAALVVLALGYGSYEALSFGYLAKIFPLYISLFCLVLAFINLGLEVRRSLREIQDSGVGLVDLESDWDIPMTAVIGRFCFFLGILLLLYGGICLVGYPLSITIFLVLFYRFITKTAWWEALVAGFAGLGFISLISRLMVIDWPSGIIQDWVNLPWPLG